MPKYSYSFKSPAYVEQKVVNDKGVVVGTIRIKPSSVCWKPKSGKQFYSVSLDDFAAWIMDKKTKANRRKS